MDESQQRLTLRQTFSFLAFSAYLVAVGVHDMARAIVSSNPLGTLAGAASAGTGYVTEVATRVWRSNTRPRGVMRSSGPITPAQLERALSGDGAAIFNAPIRVRGSETGTTADQRDPTTPLQGQSTPPARRPVSNPPAAVLPPARVSPLVPNYRRGWNQPIIPANSMASRDFRNRLALRWGVGRGSDLTANRPEADARVSRPVGAGPIVGRRVEPISSLARTTRRSAFAVPFHPAATGASTFGMGGSSVVAAVGQAQPGATPLAYGVGIPSGAGSMGPSLALGGVSGVETALPGYGAGGGQVGTSQGGEMGPVEEEAEPEDRMDEEDWDVEMGEESEEEDEMEVDEEREEAEEAEEEEEEMDTSEDVGEGTIDPRPVAVHHTQQRAAQGPALSLSMQRLHLDDRGTQVSVADNTWPVPMDLDPPAPAGVDQRKRAAAAPPARSAAPAAQQMPSTRPPATTPLLAAQPAVRPAIPRPVQTAQDQQRQLRRQQQMQQQLQQHLQYHQQQQPAQAPLPLPQEPAPLPLATLPAYVPAQVAPVAMMMAPVAQRPAPPTPGTPTPAARNRNPVPAPVPAPAPVFSAVPAARPQQQPVPAAAPQFVQPAVAGPPPRPFGYVSGPSASEGDARRRNAPPPPSPPARPVFRSEPVGGGGPRPKRREPAAPLAPAPPSQFVRPVVASTTPASAPPMSFGDDADSRASQGEAKRRKAAPPASPPASPPPRSGGQKQKRRGPPPVLAPAGPTTPVRFRAAPDFSFGEYPFQGPVPFLAGPVTESVVAARQLPPPAPAFLFGLPGSQQDRVVPGLTPATQQEAQSGASVPAVGSTERAPTPLALTPISSLNTAQDGQGSFASLTAAEREKAADLEADRRYLAKTAARASEASAAIFDHDARMRAETAGAAANMVQLLAQAEVDRKASDQQHADEREADRKEREEKRKAREAKEWQAKKMAQLAADSKRREDEKFRKRGPPKGGSGASRGKGRV